MAENSEQVNTVQSQKEGGNQAAQEEAGNQAAQEEAGNQAAQEGAGNQAAQEEAEDQAAQEEEAENSEDEDLDENLSDNEDEMKKLEDSYQKDYLLNIHTELKQINHSELEALSRIIRNKDGNIIDKLHKTIPFLTKYERARILGLRTKQINNGSAIFVEADKHIIDGYNIALLELEQKKIPFIIQRPLPNGGSEYWNVSDLEIIDY